MNSITIFLGFIAILVLVVAWYAWLIPALLVLGSTVFMWLAAGAAFVPLIAILGWVLHE